MMIGSLALMARRAHTRDHFGRTASAVRRSAVPVVLGFGGWFLGHPLVLPTMPTVPIDDMVLMTVSTAAPVGLPVYLAWVHRSWAKQTKLIGAAAAVLGALVGAVLAFHAGAGVRAIVPTIFGAVAGANLAVIGLDMVMDNRVETPPTEEVDEPQRELVSVG